MHAGSCRKGDDHAGAVEGRRRTCRARLGRRAAGLRAAKAQPRSSRDRRTRQRTPYRAATSYAALPPAPAWPPAPPRESHSARCLLGDSHPWPGSAPGMALGVAGCRVAGWLTARVDLWSGPLAGHW